MLSYRLGVWVWGFFLSVWLFFVVVGLARPGWSWSLAWSDSLASHDSLAAAVTAVLGVIWSWFLKLDKEPAKPVVQPD